MRSTISFTERRLRVVAPDRPAPNLLCTGASDTRERPETMRSKIFLIMGKLLHHIRIDEFGAVDNANPSPELTRRRGAALSGASHLGNNALRPRGPPQRPERLGWPGLREDDGWRRNLPSRPWRNPRRAPTDQAL